MRLAVIASTLLFALTASASIAHADEAGDVKACNGGSVVKCEEASERYLLGNGGYAKDPLKSMAFLEKACNLKSGKACNNAGTRWAEGKDGAPAVEYGKARQLYEKACTLKNGIGCFNLGNVFRTGEGTPIDLKAALTAYTKSCDVDEARGCTELGILYYEGKATPKDVKKATALFEKGCKLKSQASCKNVELLKKNP